MDTKVTTGELAAHLDEYLDRVRESGERIVIERDGEGIAVLTACRAPIGITGTELVKRLGDVEMPGDGFADDLEAAQNAQLPVEVREWPD